MLEMKTRGGGTGPLGKPRIQRKLVEDIVMILLAFFSHQVFLPLIFLFIIFLLLICNQSIYLHVWICLSNYNSRHPVKIEILEIVFKSCHQVNTQKGNSAEKILANVLNSPLPIFLRRFSPSFSPKFWPIRKMFELDFSSTLYWLQFRQVETELSNIISKKYISQKYFLLSYNQSQKRRKLSR